MFNKLSLRQKLTGLILILVAATVSLSAYLSYDQRVKNLQAQYLDNLNALADLQVDYIHRFAENAKADVAYIRNLEVFQQDQAAETPVADTLVAQDSDPFAAFGAGTDDAGAASGLFGMMDAGSEDITDYASSLSPLKQALGVEAIIVTKTDGSIVYNTNADSRDNIRKFINNYDQSIIDNALKGVSFSKVFKSGSEFHVIIGAPAGTSGDPENLVFIELGLEHLYDLFNNNLGMAGSFATILAQKRENTALVLNPVRTDTTLALTKFVDLDSSKVVNEATAVRHAALGQEGFGSAYDFKGNQILASWKYIPEMDWGLVVQIEKSEVKQEAFASISKFLIYGGILLIISIIVGYVLSQYYVNPLLALKTSLGSISKGILPDKVEKRHNDEVGEMAATTDELVQGLKRTATFAEQIGKGELNAEFQPLSDQDILGNTLLEMRTSLQENEKRDKERNWIVVGVAEISEILRSHNTINELGEAVIAYITEKVDAVQGAFYVVNDDDKDDVFIEMNASYAYHKKKHLQARFKFAQGLVGQAAAEQASILRTEIPEDYVSVTSGLLGEKKPGCILLTPMITEEKVFGILEFAGLHKFSPMQIKFVEEISVIIARTIFNIKVNERTRHLLEESQKMSNELQEQQEVLRQNAEEMAATQEELKRTNQRLEDQIEEVNRTQTRMQLLLENASEVIAIYEEDRSVRYISPSITKILGYDQNDLTGIKDEKYVVADYIDLYHKMFQAVHDNPYESKTIQYEYIKKDGESVWLESTATNLLSDPSIQGIIVNSRDITERRRAEQEERMRSKMQALSENSPDLITRLDQEGNFFYINPIIENYTGQKPSDFLNRNIEQVNLPGDLKDNWRNILKEVEEQNNKISTEMDFPSEMGDRVMQVNAIPEYDEGEKIESVLVVSHDITDRKLIELEIQSKNKKITESINYAKRIQGAILPNNTVIRKFIPDSFILYKAKDVVSGDFPWFVRVNDVTYFAAVDCTGHGVPGALISLIGYFLLNEIVKGRKITDPGEILDALDHSVTQTLRQDQDDSKTKDGMDIALCKIDPANSEVTYAGAHRPLYYHDGKELVEIKGDRFPIGGGIFKNQTNFTSTKLKVKKGDSVFFCSDGYPDQFGGPDNRKFGPKRLRELIINNIDKSLPEIYEAFDGAWEDWKGDGKQTDDVLMIGIRF